jgi:hypothetical protein
VGPVAQCPTPVALRDQGRSPAGAKIGCPQGPRSAALRGQGRLPAGAKVGCPQGPRSVARRGQGRLSSRTNVGCPQGSRNAGLYVYALSESCPLHSNPSALAAFACCRSWVTKTNSGWRRSRRASAVAMCIASSVFTTVGIGIDARSRIEPLRVTRSTLRTSRRNSEPACATP